MAFSTTTLSMRGYIPSPPDSAGVAQATPEIIDNATSAPESPTPTALKGGNFILNLTLPKGLLDQELPAHTDSDVTPVENSVANDDNSTYLE